MAQNIWIQPLAVSSCLAIFVILSVWPDFVYGQGGGFCRTFNDSYATNAPCVFPFKYQKKIFRKCTTMTDPEGKHWCSTRTDNDDKHIGGRGFWGHCREECPKYRKKIRTTTTTTTTRPTTRFTTRRTTTRRTTRTTTRRTRFTRPVVQTRPSRSTTIAPHRVTESPYGMPSNGDYQPTEESLHCGQRVDTGYIIGGTTAKQGEFPFMALLGYRWYPNGIANIRYGCAGTLINRMYVLTAAHCHDTRNPIVEVVLGEYDTASDPDCPNPNSDTCRRVQKFPITLQNVIVHERWDIRKVTTEGNDIALIRLPWAAITTNEDSSHAVFPICMPWNSGIEMPDEELIVAGWGRTHNNRTDYGNIFQSGTFSNVLKKLTVPLVPIQQCKSRYDLFSNISSLRHICAGGETGKDSCSGDSGGPLIARNRPRIRSDGIMYLKGIVSFGTNKCGRGYPGVYTNVEYFMGWILSHMRP